jgi:cytochrome oxidase Cu insertion factor (SCO1/SenC/PrrC family)
MRVFGLAAAFAVALGCSRSVTPGEPQKTEVVSSAPAPDAELSDASGTMVTLSTVLGRHAETILVFYRGFW